MDLTGKFYFKQTLLGLVLMVEYKEADTSPGSFLRRWRRAKNSDLVYLDIKISSFS